MSCPFPKQNLRELEMFVNICKQDPNVLHFDELKFFRDYIEALGGTIPAKTATKTDTPKFTPPPSSNTESVHSSSDEEDDAESVVDLDMTGVLDNPDSETPSEPMGIDVDVVTEEAMDSSNEKKRAAVDFYVAGNYEEATKAYTEAILLNPASAMLYAKRGQSLLAQNKPNACVRDCNKALELNPDSAAAYKFRGRARGLLGDFVKAAEDLRCACKLDFDEQTDEWLKEVTPNARKIEEHNRKYERLRAERKLRQRQRAAQKARSKAQAQAPPSPDMSDMNIPPDFLKLFDDPEFKTAMQDPEIAAAFMEISQDPSKLFMYQGNPKVAKFLEKASTLLAGKMGGAFGGMPGMGGFPGFGGAPPSAGPDASAKPPADVDLD